MKVLLAKCIRLFWHLPSHYLGRNTPRHPRLVDMTWEPLPKVRRYVIGCECGWGIECTRINKSSV